LQSRATNHGTTAPMGLTLFNAKAEKRRSASFASGAVRLSQAAG